MFKFRRILFVCSTEGSQPNPVDRVIELAYAHGAEVTLATFEEKVPRRKQRVLAGVMPVEEFERLVAERQREGLARIAAEFEGAGVNVSSRVLSGRRSLALIREVLSDHHDIVVKTRESTDTSRLSSEDQRLLRKCPCPVLVLDPEVKFRRILAAVDPDTEDAEQLALSQRVISLAADLATIHKAELHVVHAWDFLGEEMLYEGFGRLTHHEIEDLLSRQEELHRVALAELLDNYEQDVPHTSYLRRGSPASVICSVATEVEADMVVLGTVGRTGIRGFFVGNTAESVLQQVQGAVLALKPVGFQSPVADS